LIATINTRYNQELLVLFGRVQAGGVREGHLAIY
jgi:hypothetical protein